MRRVQIFSGSSNPALCDLICERLGRTPSKVQLKKFSNGETSVEVEASIRDQDVFIVQGGGAKVNDAIMETLILIAACKGSSANKITAVLPYFPYSKQSKKKSHRGAITARMLANLLTVAGVDHVITVDLHASQMKGFFSKPVDNLSAEPIFAKWIRQNVPNWREAVVVSKNPGGTKRVTSLADALKINFALITTDKRRAIHDSTLQSRRHSPAQSEQGGNRVVVAEASGEKNGDKSAEKANGRKIEQDTPPKPPSEKSSEAPHIRRRGLSTYLQHQRSGSSDKHNILGINTHVPHRNVPHPDSHMSPHHSHHHSLSSLSSHPLKEQHNGVPEEEEENEEEEAYNDDQVSNVTTGRLIQGHVVDDDYPSPSMSASIIEDGGNLDHMMSSIYSTTSSLPGNDSYALGGVENASDDDDAPQDHIERMITLVGEVKNKTIFIVDDMIDRASSWVAAAELAVKRCGAKKVYCIATHGLFGYGTLDEMEECQCIDKIVVTNSFPLGDDITKKYKKLIVLDLSHLLGEAIRRNHHGENISPLYSYYYYD